MTNYSDSGSVYDRSTVLVVDRVYKPESSNTAVINLKTADMLEYVPVKRGVTYLHVDASVSGVDVHLLRIDANGRKYTQVIGGDMGKSPGVDKKDVKVFYRDPRSYLARKPFPLSVYLKPDFYTVWDSFPYEARQRLHYQKEIRSDAVELDLNSDSCYCLPSQQACCTNFMLCDKTPRNHPVERLVLNNLHRHTIRTFLTDIPDPPHHLHIYG